MRRIEPSTHEQHDPLGSAQQDVRFVVYDPVLLSHHGRLDVATSDLQNFGQLRDLDKRIDAGSDDGQHDFSAPNGAEGFVDENYFHLCA